MITGPKSGRVIPVLCLLLSLGACAGSGNSGGSGGSHSASRSSQQDIDFYDLTKVTSRCAATFSTVAILSNADGKTAEANYWEQYSDKALALSYTFATYYTGNRAEELVQEFYAEESRKILAYLESGNDHFLGDNDCTTLMEGIDDLADELRRDDYGR